MRLASHFGKMLHRGSGSALVVRNTCYCESHFNAAEGSCEHQVIEIPEVSDAEDFIHDFAKSASERHTETLEHNLTEFVRGGVAPQGIKTAVTVLLCWLGSRLTTSRPQARTARRVASAWRSCRAKTFFKPSSRIMLSDSRSP